MSYAIELIEEHGFMIMDESSHTPAILEFETVEAAEAFLWQRDVVVVMHMHVVELNGPQFIHDERLRFRYPDDLIG